MHGAGRGILREKVVAGPLGWHEMQGGKSADQAPVHLLGEGRVDVVRAQSRLDMGDGASLIISRETAGEGRCGIALYNDPVGPRLPDNAGEGRDRPSGENGQILAGPHEIQVVIRDDSEYIEHLIQHGSVLGGRADKYLKLGHGLKSLYQRGEFDRLRARAHNEQYS